MMRMTSWLIVVDVVHVTMYFLMSSFVKDLFVFGNLCINIYMYLSFLVRVLVCLWGV